MSDFAGVADDDVVARAVSAVRDGDLVVAPTDTVYTVFTDAFQTSATQRMFAAKRRSRDLPLSLLIRNPRQVIGLARDVPETAERLMAAYWPGPVSIILPAQPDMPWDLGDTEGTIGLRMPADDLLLGVAAEIGPLACSAANRRGEPTPTTAEDAEAQLGDEVALYIDGGERPGGASTVVDCTRAEVVVVREGVIPADEIMAVASGEVGWGQRPHSEEP